MSGTSEDEIREFAKLLRSIPTREFYAEGLATPDSDHLTPNQIVMLASADGREITSDLRQQWDHVLSCSQCYADLADARDFFLPSEGEEPIVLPSSFMEVLDAVDTLPTPSKTAEQVWQAAGLYLFAFHLKVMVDYKRKEFQLAALNAAIAEMIFTRKRPLIRTRGTAPAAIQSVKLPLPEANGILQIDIHLSGNEVIFAVTPVFEALAVGESVGRFQLEPGEDGDPVAKPATDAKNGEEYRFSVMELEHTESLQFQYGNHVFRVDLNLSQLSLG